ncbi:hypothetical protein C8F01DRAFT_1374946 [Mycena amicta]|nr:hypothetical protein C8F01DRAFT_1374946 [Mycena amicta]
MANLASHGFAVPLIIISEPWEEPRTAAGSSNIPPFALSARRSPTVSPRAQRSLHSLGCAVRNAKSSAPNPEQPTAPRIHTIPLPPQIPGITSVVLHPELISNKRDLDFAVLRVPHLRSNSSIPDVPQCQWPELRSAQATFPALPSLTMISPDVPWAITAHASGEVIPHLSVVDVLLAISQALQMRIGIEDWVRYANSNTKHKSRSDKTQYRNSNLRRIDLLDGRTKFVGLAASDSESEDVWILKTT